jgi:hypothetical protein
VFFGLNLNELQTFRDRVNAVTPADISRAARSYLHPDKLTVVLVGDASSFVKQLPAAGFDTFDVIPASELDLFSPDLRRKALSPRGQYRPAADVQPAGRTKPDTAKVLLDKAIAAKGGLAKLRAIRTLRAETTTTVRAPTGTVTFPSTTWIEYPDHFRVDAQMPGGSLAQVFAGGRFWMQDAGGVNEMPEQARAPMQSAIERDVIRLLVRAADGELIVREIDADEPQQDALEISGGGMAAVSLYVNRDNGLIEKARYTSGAEGRSEERYSDYRRVNSVQFAFHTLLKRGSLPEIERDVKTIRYNVPIPPGLFVKPPS